MYNDNMDKKDCSSINASTNANLSPHVPSKRLLAANLAIRSTTQKGDGKPRGYPETHLMQIVEPLRWDDSAFLRHECQKLGVGVIRGGIGISTNLIHTGGKGEPCDRRCVPFALLGSIVASSWR